MRKTYLLKVFGVFLVGILIVPQVTFAAWWNPFSWNVWGVFSRQNSENKIEIPEVSSNELATTTVTNKLIEKDDDKARLEADRKALDARTEALRVAEEKLRIQSESARLMEEARQVQLRLQEIEQETKQSIIKEEIKNEELDTTILRVGEITCTERPAGTYYFLPFTVKGEWVSGLVQVKITDNNGGVITKGLDLDKSNINDGFVFGQTGGSYDSYGGFRNVSLKAGMKGTYQINIHSVVPRYVSAGGRVFPSYSASSLVAEESDTFVLPSC